VPVLLLPRPNLSVYLLDPLNRFALRIMEEEKLRDLNLREGMAISTGWSPCKPEDVFFQVAPRKYYAQPSYFWGLFRFNECCEVKVEFPDEVDVLEFAERTVEEELENDAEVMRGSLRRRILKQEGKCEVDVSDAMKQVEPRKLYIRVDVLAIPTLRQFLLFQFRDEGGEWLVDPRKLLEKFTKYSDVSEELCRPLLIHVGEFEGYGRGVVITSNPESVPNYFSGLRTPVVVLNISKCENHVFPYCKCRESKGKKECKWMMADPEDIEMLRRQCREEGLEVWR